jgi:hypothetical protein
MLESLHLKNVGPAPVMDMALTSRLNLITGDNGLGKSFLLDVAWWALTRQWPHDINARLTSGYRAQPRDPKLEATIGFRLTTKAGNKVAYESKYEARDEAWRGRPGRPWNPGLVIYAHADGGFSVWDPAKNYWKVGGEQDVQERLPAFVFSPQEVWDGLEMPVHGKSTTVCNGLIRDWASWIKEGGQDATLVAMVLQHLAAPGEKLVVDSVTRISLDDARDIPTLRTAYAERPIPILHASAGVRRIAALAYMLQWSWNENGIAAGQLGEEPTDHVILLMDEVESHLHPKWQRAIVPSVLGLMRTLHGGAQLQFLGATHSPLVLASVEPEFQTDRDKIFHLQLREGKVALEEQAWTKQGDVVNWLVSDTFGMLQGRSLDAERAIEAAEAWMRNELEELPDGLKTAAEIDAELHRVLADHDTFWPRWVVWVENHKGATP